MSLNIATISLTMPCQESRGKK